MYAKYIKRILDFLLSFIAIIVLSPVYLVLAILVRIKLGKPILFTQERIGKGENPFKLYKFRSMTDQRDDEGNLLPDEVRLTGFGGDYIIGTPLGIQQKHYVSIPSTTLFVLNVTDFNTKIILSFLNMARKISYLCHMFSFYAFEQIICLKDSNTECGVECPLLT